MYKLTMHAQTCSHVCIFCSVLYSMRVASYHMQLEPNRYRVPKLKFCTKCRGMIFHPLPCDSRQNPTLPYYFSRVPCVPTCVSVICHMYSIASYTTPCIYHALSSVLHVILYVWLVPVTSFSGHLRIFILNHESRLPSTSATVGWMTRMRFREASVRPWRHCGRCNLPTDSRSRKGWGRACSKRPHT